MIFYENGFYGFLDPQKIGRNPSVHLELSNFKIISKIFNNNNPSTNPNIENEIQANSGTHFDHDQEQPEVRSYRT